jgi:hypothetical protein
MSAPAITKSQRRALDWLTRQGGDGVFDKTHVLVAAGERLSGGKTEESGFMYGTWLALEKAGLVEFYGGKNGRGRVRVKKARAA